MSYEPKHLKETAVPRRKGLGLRLAATGGLLAATGGFLGLGLNATFTDTDVATQSIETGTVDIALGASGAQNRIDVAATNIAPGDEIQRAFTLSNTGSLDLSGITVTSTAARSSLLDTDTVDGLQMRIDRCSVPWTEAGTSPAFTYSCAGVISSVVNSGPVIASGQDMPGLAAETAGSADNLRLVVTLPKSAGNDFQGIGSVIQYDFTGTQRTATNR